MIRRLVAVATAAAAIGAASACGGGGSETYPATAVDNFVTECESSAVESAGGALTSERARTICRCVIDELQETLPYEDFTRYEGRLRLGEDAEAPDAVVDAFTSCTDA